LLRQITMGLRKWQLFAWSDVHQTTARNAAVLFD
jgi:hypothetical protein